MIAHTYSSYLTVIVVHGLATTVILEQRAQQCTELAINMVLVHSLNLAEISLQYYVMFKHLHC